MPFDKPLFEAGIVQAFVSSWNEKGLQLKIFDRGKNAVSEVVGLMPYNEFSVGKTNKKIARESVGSMLECVITTCWKDGVRVYSRRRLQQMFFNSNIKGRLRPGDIVEAKVSAITNTVAFFDMGFGIPGLLPLKSSAVVQTSSMRNRFQKDEKSFVVLRHIDKEGKITLSHREVLGTWSQNVSSILGSSSKTGIVRSVKDYGIFVELTPNLVALTEGTGEIPVEVNDIVRVKILNIKPRSMKVRAEIIERVEDEPECVSGEDFVRFRDYSYFLPSNDPMHIDNWVYSPGESKKRIESVFKEGAESVFKEGAESVFKEGADGN